MFRRVWVRVFRRVWVRVFRRVWVRVFRRVWVRADRGVWQWCGEACRNTHRQFSLSWYLSSHWQSLSTTTCTDNAICTVVLADVTSVVVALSPQPLLSQSLTHSPTPPLPHRRLSPVSFQHRKAAGRLDLTFKDKDTLARCLYRQGGPLSSDNLTVVVACVAGGGLGDGDHHCPAQEAVIAVACTHDDLWALKGRGKLLHYIAHCTCVIVTCRDLQCIHSR